MPKPERSSVAFACFNCDSRKLKVVESRSRPEKREGGVLATIRRARMCLECKQMFDTVERVAIPANLRFRK